MKGENLFNFMDRIKVLEDKKISNKLSEREVIELNNLANGARLFSLNELKDYHKYIRALLRNSSELKEDLLKRFKEVCSDESYDLIKDVVENVCDNNLFIKNMKEEKIICI